MHRFLSRVQLSASNKPTLSRTRPPPPRPTPRTQNTLIRRNNPQVLNSPIRRYAYRPARNRYAGRSLSRADDHSRVFSGLVSVPRCIGVLLQSCADRSQGLPGPVYRYIGVLLQFCADRSRYCAILRHSLRGSLRVGVSAYCLFLGGSSGRCVGVSASFNFFDPLRGHTEPFGPLSPAVGVSGAFPFCCSRQLLDSTLEDRLTF